MKKISKRDVFVFLLGAIIFSGVTYAATILASSITYDNTSSGINANNVQGAIDELYTKANNPTIPANYKELSTVTTATSGDILSGKTAYNNLGELMTGGLSVTDCVKGSFVCGSGCTGSSGQQILDFKPSVFVLYDANGVDVYVNTINSTYDFYINKDYATGLAKQNINDLFIKNNKFIVHDFGNDLLNSTFNYMACR